MKFDKLLIVFLKLDSACSVQQLARTLSTVHSSRGLIACKHERYCLGTHGMVLVLVIELVCDRHIHDHQLAT